MNPKLILKKAACVGFILLTSLVLAAVVHADTTPAADGGVPHPEFQVLRARCENGALTAIELAVSGPGVVAMHWDNKLNCGERT